MPIPGLDAQESVLEAFRSSLPMKFNAQTQRALTSNLKEQNKIKLEKLFQVS